MKHNFLTFATTSGQRFHKDPVSDIDLVIAFWDDPQVLAKGWRLVSSGEYQFMGFNTLKACSMVTLKRVVNKDQLEINTNWIYYIFLLIFSFRHSSMFSTMHPAQTCIRYSRFGHQLVSLVQRLHDIRLHHCGGNSLVPPACSIHIAPSPEPQRVFSGVQTHLKRTIACCLLHVTKDNCGKYPDPFLPNLSKDHVWKGLTTVQR